MRRIFELLSALLCWVPQTFGYTMGISSGMQVLSSMFDGFIIDQWGVLHDGKAPYAGTVTCLESLRSAGKKIVLLSNSSKRKASAYKGLAKVGFQSYLFDDCITSGELGWQMIAQNRIPTLDFSTSSNKKVFVFGNGDDDLEYISSSGCNLAPISSANFMLARGTFTLLDGISGKVFQSADLLLEESNEILQQAVSRDVLLFVTNPDVMRPGCNSAMPGQIGERYAQLGGRVHYIGKPHAAVYEECFHALDIAQGHPMDRTRICGIGDSLLHDIKGANAAQIASVWTTNGVHCQALGTTEGSSAPPEQDLVRNLILKYDIQPSYSMPRFMW